MLPASFSLRPPAASVSYFFDAADLTGLRIELQEAQDALRWPHHPLKTIFSAKSRVTRNGMGQRLQNMIQYVDAKTGIFNGSSSVKIELIQEDKFTMTIPFGRDPNGQLIRGDMHLRDCKIFCDLEGNKYNQDEWKQRNVRRALHVKDEMLISDPQYHALRGFVLETLRGQGCCKGTPKQHSIPCLGHVKTERGLLDQQAKDTLGLRPVIGPPQESFRVRVGADGTITASPRYNRPFNMIGCAFDLKSMFIDGMQQFWPQFSIRHDKGLPICLRLTVDGAMLTDSKSFCTASLRWLVDGLNPSIAEWLLMTVHCTETLDNLELYFAQLFKEVEAINADKLIFTPRGCTSPVEVQINIVLCPDAKMLNVSL